MRVKFFPIVFLVVIFLFWMGVSLNAQSINNTTGLASARMNLNLPQKGEEDNPTTRINGHEHSSVFGDTPEPSWPGDKKEFTSEPKIKWTVQGPGGLSKETADKTPDLKNADFSDDGNPNLPPDTPRQPGKYIIGNSAVRAMDSTKTVKDPQTGKEETVTDTTNIRAFSTQVVYVMDRTVPMVKLNVDDSGVDMNNIIPQCKKNCYSSDVKPCYVKMKESPKNAQPKDKKVKLMASSGTAHTSGNGGGITNWHK